MKPINCNECGAELTDDNWQPSRKEKKEKVCIPCYATLEKYTKRNTERMFVNGKYISKTHPLYKPGHYKTFEDAAFQSLSQYASSKEGQVYIITNPAWKGWIKIGMAVEAQDRCNQYQTSSPLRDYKLEYSKDFKYRRTAESKAHKLCSKQATDQNGEWFKLSITKAISLIDSITEEEYEKETA